MAVRVSAGRKRGNRAKSAPRLYYNTRFRVRYMRNWSESGEKTGVRLNPEVTGRCQNLTASGTKDSRGVP